MVHRRKEGWGRMLLKIEIKCADTITSALTMLHLFANKRNHPKAKNISDHVIADILGCDSSTCILATSPEFLAILEHLRAWFS